MPRTTIPVAVVALLLGAALGWLASPRGASDADDAPAARVQQLEREVASLRTELEKARAAAAAPPVAPAPALEGRPVVEPPPAAALAPAATVDPANPRALPDPRFPIAGFEAALEEVDWSVVGGNAWRLAQEMPHLADALTGKTDLSPDAIGRMQTLNGPLVTAALKFNEHVEGLEPNGAFTHPAFMSNAIAATLASAGLPLSPGQTDQLEELGRSFTAEESRRLASYDDKTYALAKLVDEAVLRDRFFDAAFGVLSPEQRNALVKPEHRGHVALDLFSSGLVWQAHVGKLAYGTVDDLVTALVQRLPAQLELTLTEAQVADLRTLVMEWLREWPAEALATPADDLSRAGLVPTGYVTDCARRQVGLLGLLPSRLSLPAPAIERVRRFDTVFLPLKNP